MPEYPSPGVYVEEGSTGPKPIKGVSTSLAGFLGLTERGPEDIRDITSWAEYSRWFGGHMGVDKSFMSYAVQGFFDNGGKRCFVGRIVGGAANQAAKVAILKTEGDSTTFVAIGRGTWGENIFVRVLSSTKAKKGVTASRQWIRVQILYFSGATVDPLKIVDPFKKTKRMIKDQRSPDMIEDFDNLSLDKSASNSVAAAINAGSCLVRLALSDQVITLSKTNEFRKLGESQEAISVSVADYQGTSEPIYEVDPELLGKSTGLTAMDTVDEVSILCAPDHVKLRDIETQLIVSCQKLKDRFAIFSTPQDFKAESPLLPFDTTFGALYHPWIWIHDPKTRQDQLVPPTGHIAGIIARTDIEQGVFKAPANAVVVGAKKLQSPITKEIQDLLNPIGVNCIRDFRAVGRGIRLWGARTMSSDPEWRSINVRRLFLFIEESIDEGTQWVLFEPNNEVTWGRVRLSVSNFLTTIWRDGGLLGSKPEEAFFVRCDRTTIDEDDIQNGRLVCQIGISPIRPAEFVVFRVSQKTANRIRNRE